MFWLLPTESEEVVQVACRVPFSVAALQPVIGVPPALNDTVPVGVPVLGELTLTVAVKVTGWPNTDGFSEELAIVVVVVALFTVCVKVAEVLVLKFVSPL